MSILIKGMEMPKYCYTCPAYDYIKSFCCILRIKVINLNDNRYKDCPLIVVPTPHGRLIDENELLRHKYGFSQTARVIIKTTDAVIEAEVSEG